VFLGSRHAPLRPLRPRPTLHSDDASPLRTSRGEVVEDGEEVVHVGAHVSRRRGVAKSAHVVRHDSARGIQAGGKVIPAAPIRDTGVEENHTRAVSRPVVSEKGCPGMPNRNRVTTSHSQDSRRSSSELTPVVRRRGRSCSTLLYVPA
jgi:hypothetical protein